MVEWTEGDGGVVSFSITLTNLTSGDLPIVATVADDETCSVTAEPDELKANQPPTKVELQLTNDCDTTAGKLKVVATAGESAFELSVKEADDANPSWKQLRMFGVLLAISLALALVTILICRATGADPFRPLKGLEADWNFKDAWATNATALGAVLTGVLGSSSVVKAILGQDAEQAIALATVGAAIATAIAIAGPIVLSILKRDGSYTLAGVLLANVFVVGGALGELWVVAWCGSHLEKVTGTDDTLIWLAASGAAILLVAYVVANTKQVWKDGATTPPVKPSPELIAAALHIKYCCGDQAIDADGYHDLVEHLGDILNAKPKNADKPKAGTDSHDSVTIHHQYQVRNVRGFGI